MSQAGEIRAWIFFSISDVLKTQFQILLTRTKGIILVLSTVYHFYIILPFRRNICILKGLYFSLKQSRQTLIKNSVKNISNWICYNGYIFFT